MSESMKKGLVPVLRFTEFQDQGEWERDKLANLIVTVTPPKKLPTVLYQTEGQFPIIDQSQSYICGWTNDQDALINDDLPLIIFGDHTCALKKVDVPFAQGADGIKILKNKKQTETSYLYQYLLFNPVVMEEYKRHFSILKEKLVSFPKKGTGEQKKIADCLTSIDELVTAQTQKVEALKDHKKGLMQQLFPAEGESVPKLRFPEFRDAGEWERDKLANLIVTVTPPQKIPTVLYQSDGQFPIIDQSQNSICGWTNDQAALINDDLPLIIFGDHTCALKIVDVPFAQGADGIKILKNKKQTETSYLYQYLLFNPVVMEEYKRHFSILKEKLVFFPKKESGEQQKIADCLSSIDDLITAQTQKLAALKAHKKGLMQQLFPTIDEVSG